MGCKPASTSMDPNLKLSAESGELLSDPFRYQRLVGRLIYLTNTQPDLTFAVSVVSQFMRSSRTAHLDTVHHILRYLKSCSDYASSLTDKRSTSGVCTFLGTHLLSWKSKKHAVVSRSSVEAKYRAMAHGTCELLWLRSILTELGFDENISYKIFCDNKSTILLAFDSVLHKQKVRARIVCPSFVPSSYQTADIFTKSVGPSLLRSSIGKLGGVEEEFTVKGSGAVNVEVGGNVVDTYSGQLW
ncbi:hypothetical protein CsSME_00024444 [Camellia sinensis var. sinensis]